MPKLLADGRIALVALTEPPAKLDAPTVAELEKGTRLECRINKADYTLGATGSSTIDEQELCKTGEAKDFGPANYEGTLTVFRYMDRDGKANAQEAIAWELLQTKGTHLWLAEREGPVASVPFEAGQEVSVYEVNTDQPQKPSDRNAGNVKRIIPLSVLDAHENVKVVAGA